MYELTVRYFKMNKLSINCSKTEILSVPYGYEESPEVVLLTEDGEFVKSKSDVKILGIRFNSSNNMSNHYHQ